MNFLCCALYGAILGLTQPQSVFHKMKASIPIVSSEKKNFLLQHFLGLFWQNHETLRQISEQFKETILPLHIGLCSYCRFQQNMLHEISENQSSKWRRSNDCSPRRNSHLDTESEGSPIWWLLSSYYPGLVLCWKQQIKVDSRNEDDRESGQIL